MFWYCIFYFPITSSISLSLSLSLSLLVSVWFLFELILDYFGSKNLSLYKNTIQTMLIINQHSVHFNLFWPLYLFGSIRFTLVHFGPPQSTLVQFGPFGQFSPIQSICSIWFTLVHFGSLQCWVLWRLAMFDLVDDSTRLDSINIAWYLIRDFLRLSLWSGGLGQQAQVVALMENFGLFYSPL